VEHTPAEIEQAANTFRHLIDIGIAHGIARLGPQIADASSTVDV
jgi:hypothetical protein